MVLLALLILICIVLIIWWLRSRLGSHWRSFGACVRTIDREIGIGDRYQTPWHLLVGENRAATEALCQAWRLNPAGDTAWFGRWWYGTDGALLAAPDSAFSHMDGALAQLSSWRRLLRALLRFRPHRPLDAIIWAVPAETLLNEEDAVAAGLRAYKKFADLQQRLGLTVPVYVVVTGGEQIPGFSELVTALPDESRDAMLGWSSPFQPAAAYRPEWADMAMDHLSISLQEGIAEVGALGEGTNEAMFLLPSRISELRGALQSLLDPVFRGNALGEASPLRGIYFVGTERIPVALDAFELSEPLTPPPAQLAFAGRLLRHRFLAEQGLAQPIPRILTMRNRWQRGALIVAGVIGAIWLTGMLWTWGVNRREAQTLANNFDRLSAARAEYTAAPPTEEASRQAASAVAAALHVVPRWKMSSAWWPSSLLSSDDGDVETALSLAIRDLLFKPFSNGLKYRIQSVQSVGKGSSGVTSTDPQSPESWPDIVAAVQLVTTAAQYEQRTREFNQLLQEGGGNVDVAADLTQYLFSLELAPRQLRDRMRITRVMQRTAGTPGLPLNLAPFQGNVSDRFVALLTHWIDALYADSNLVVNAEAVEKGLQGLQSKSDIDARTLSQLADRIELLRRLVATTNSAWSGTKGRDLVPSFSSSIETARHMSLIGEQPVAKVLAHADSVKHAFSDRWLSTQAALPGVLQASPTGGIELQSDIGKLYTSLRTLLRQPFVASASALVEGQGRTTFEKLDADSATSALIIFQAYQKYREGDLATAPELYRPALLAAASNNTTQAMLHTLTEHDDPDMLDKAGPQGLHEDSVRLDALRKVALNLSAAFGELDQPELVNVTTQEVSRRSLSLLRRADEVLQGLGPYQPRQGSFVWWDGTPGASLRAFESPTPQDLQAYLAAQQDAVSNLANIASASVIWLQERRYGLSAEDQRLVQRWQALAVDLEKYKAKSPASSLTVLERIVTKDLNELDVNTCQAKLAQISYPRGVDLFAERTGALLRAASDRCTSLRAQAGATAYQQLADTFNRNLAGRFPFSSNPAAPGADPEVVAAFLRQLDGNLVAARASLDGQTAKAQSAQAFLDSLDQARSWLTPMLAKDSTGAWTGVDVMVNWRTDREREIGADQIIEWSLTSAGQTLRHPTVDKSTLRWRPGQAISLTLRWAKDAPQAPLDDPTQISLNVDGPTAIWQERDNWSLLRLLRSHAAASSVMGADAPDGTPLLFLVPVRNSGGPAGRTQVFLRLAFTTAGGKDRLSLLRLPNAAPPSPYPNITLASVRQDANGVSP